jgi:putative colanic acid biosynthesis acetyltransferase WcaF
VSKETDDKDKVDLSAFTTGDYDRGASRIKEALWLIFRPLVFQWLPGRWYGLKAAVLRAFGANIGRNVAIKPGFIVTMPWKLTVGDNCWLGEDCYIQSLAPIVMEDNVALAQQVFLATGNHNIRRPTFDLEVAPIHIESGSWLTSCTRVGPGVRVGSHAVLCMGSVATDDLEPYGIYRGNPAVKVGERRIDPA